MIDKAEEAITGLINDHRPKTFEDLLVAIKHFGLFQILLVIFTFAFQVFTAMTNLAIVFYQISPDHSCQVPEEGWGNLKWTLEQKKNFTAPIIDPKEGELDKCSYWNISEYKDIFANYQDDFDGAMLARPEVGINKTKTIACDNWDYDRSGMHETVVTEWDLVCEGKWMMEHGTMMNFVGMLLGSLISGFSSDQFGRKTAFLGSLTLMGVSGLGLSFVPSYTWFMIVRLIASCCAISAALVNYCYLFEFLTGRPRSIVGGLFFVPYACSYSLMAGVAYLTRDWRLFNGICAGPAILAALFWCILPESPRWLLAKGRVPEARKILEQAAKINGVKMPDVDLEAISNAITGAEVASAAAQSSFLAVFRYRTLLFRTVAVFAIWIINVMVYYGLALNVSSFSGDVFVNNALAGAPVEVPAYIILTFLLMLGRKPAGYLSLFFCGVCLIATIWIPTGTIKTVCGLAGKLGVTISFGVIYVHTTELFPTVIRNTGLSLSSAVSRFGSMIAPYISSLNKLGAAYAFLPLLIFGIFAIFGAAFTILLPETLNRGMPETLMEAAALKMFGGRAKIRKQIETELQNLKTEE